VKRCNKCGCEKPLDQFHIAKSSSDGRYFSCKECTLNWQREKYRANREAKLAANARWYADHPEKRSEYRLAAKQRRPGAAADASRKYRQRHPEARREYGKKYFAEHKERFREWQRRRYQRSPDKFAEYRHRWRAGQSDGRPTALQWAALLNDCGRRCLACGMHASEIKAFYPNRRKMLELDHIIPVAMGGKTGMDNIQPLCPSCNNSKRKKAIDYRPREIRAKYGPFAL
jgi:5-methylcytosine-specific restriction endonuclease McrA